jgi:hypothetical protein
VPFHHAGHKNYATELKLRAERLLGELLKDTVNHNGSRGQLKGSIVEPQKSTLPPDISKKSSHRWQRVASEPEPTSAGTRLHRAALQSVH